MTTNETRDKVYISQIKLHGNDIRKVTKSSRFILREQFQDRVSKDTAYHQIRRLTKRYAKTQTFAKQKSNGKRRTKQSIECLQNAVEYYAQNHDKSDCLDVIAEKSNIIKGSPK